MNSIHDFPGIKRASIAVAYDNGLINRDTPEHTFLARVEILLDADGTTSEELRAIDAALQTLDDDMNELLCCGEDSQQHYALCHIPRELRKKTHGLLNDIFEV